MQTPLLTPIHYITNKKKRSRSNDDFESNYFKKRLVSAPLPEVSHKAALFSSSNKDSSMMMNNNNNKNTPTSPPLQPTKDSNSVQIDDMDDFLSENDQSLQEYTNSSSLLLNNKNNQRIHMVDVNGTILPMEYKNGETKYSIPGFVVLNKQIPLPKQEQQQGQLILYQPNTLLPLSPPTTPPQMGNSDEEEEEEEYEPMDLD